MTAKRRPRREGIVLRRHEALGDWGQFSVDLSRGGEQWTPYEGLSERLRQEWDAFEYLLMGLARGRFLYVVGGFERVPQGIRGHRICIGKHAWTGMVLATTREELHSIFAGSPTYDYGYLIANQRLTDAEAAHVSNVFQRHKGMSEGLFGAFAPSYCAIEESDDRDWFDLTCHREDISDIVATIVSALAEQGLRVRDL